MCTRAGDWSCYFSWCYVEDMPADPVVMLCQVLWKNTNVDQHAGSAKGLPHRLSTLQHWLFEIRHSWGIGLRKAQNSWQSLFSRRNPAPTRIGKSQVWIFWTLPSWGLETQGWWTCKWDFGPVFCVISLFFPCLTRQTGTFTSPQVVCLAKCPRLSQKNWDYIPYD